VDYGTGEGDIDYCLGGLSVLVMTKQSLSYDVQPTNNRTFKKLLRRYQKCKKPTEYVK
jgi:hypothetical protein